MTWKKRLKYTMAVSLLTVALAACSEELATMSPQEIIENVVQDKQQPLAYYGHSTTTLTDGTTMTTTEWKMADGKARTEVTDSLGSSLYTVSDGTSIWLHDVVSNEVIEYPLDEEDLHSINRSPSEQAKLMLETIEQTHNVTVIGDEKLLDRPVIHIKATPKTNEENLFGEQELWIDKETWFVLKSVSTIDGQSTMTAYTAFETNPSFDDELFVFDMPSDAQLVDIGEPVEPFVLHDIEEAKPYIKKPFYYVANTSDVTLHDISVSVISDEMASLTLNYISNDAPYFSLVVMAVDEPNVPYAASEETINIRGQQAHLIGGGGFRSISWVEDGIGYALLISEADVATEDVVALFEAIK